MSKSNELPTPITRQEQYLYEIAQNGGADLPVAQNEKDILYWHNGEWTTGAITNVIPDGDNLSY